MATPDPPRRRRQRNPFEDDDDEDRDGVGTSPPPSGGGGIPHDPLLDHYESRLHSEVDSDFFHPPEEFHALNRVIDIIGAEISDGRSTFGGDGGGDEVSFGHIPAYQRIRKQQRLVEEAIEHMAVKHCADLNSSVTAVGRMSRQFDEAKMRVRTLRCVPMIFWMAVWGHSFQSPKLIISSTARCTRINLLHKQEAGEGRQG